MTIHHLEGCQARWLRAAGNGPHSRAEVVELDEPQMLQLLTRKRFDAKKKNAHRAINPTYIMNYERLDSFPKGT